MKWTALSPLNVEDFLPEALRERIEEHNLNVSVNLEMRQLQEKQQADAANLDVLTMSKADVENAKHLGFNLLRTFRDEWKLRNERKALLAEIRDAAGAAADAAHAAHEEEGRKVRQDLVGIGYLDEPPELGKIGTITPGMVASHPKVYSALQLLTALRARRNNTTDDQANDEALREVAAALEELRRKLTGS